jgi:hypothetical protein
VSSGLFPKICFAILHLSPYFWTQYGTAVHFFCGKLISS